MNVLLSCLQNEAIQKRAQYCQNFQTGKPFKNLAIEDFFKPDFLESLISEFPDFKIGNDLNENGEAGGKSTVEKIRDLGPAFSQLDDLIQDQTFLDWISEVTGISDLRYDPWYFGGGTHENRTGQDLDPHVDFNRHPVTQWHRRVNLIIYLNEDWDEAWGATIDLHLDPSLPPEQDEIKSLLPLKNRAVLFETTENSWHGFNRIQIPENESVQSRKSIALYFYTLDRPEEETGPNHSTIYQDRHLPEHIQPGQILSEADYETIQILLARRDGHIKRLYGDLKRLSSELELSRARKLVRGIRYTLNSLKRALGFNR